MPIKDLDKRRESVKRWRRAHPEQIRKIMCTRNWKLLGIKTTYEEYKIREREQGGVCAICGNPPKKNSLHQDHWHGDGRPRGLLCTRCNVALGVLESPLLESYLKYLVKWSDDANSR